MLWYSKHLYSDPETTEFNSVLESRDFSNPFQKDSIDKKIIAEHRLIDLSGLHR